MLLSGLPSLFLRHPTRVDRGARRLRPWTCRDAQVLARRRRCSRSGSIPGAGPKRAAAVGPSPAYQGIDRRASAGGFPSAWLSTIGVRGRDLPDVPSSVSRLPRRPLADRTHSSDRNRGRPRRAWSTRRTSVPPLGRSTSRLPGSAIPTCRARRGGRRQPAEEAPSIRRHRRRHGPRPWPRSSPGLSGRCHR